MLRRLNESLPYLMLCIVLYAIAVELIGVWFVSDKISYSIGLWYGAAIAMGMAYNLAKILYDSITAGGAKKAWVIAKSLIRYFVVVILLLAIGYFKFGNLYMAIIGVFGLKIAAYLTPPVTKLIYRLKGERSPLENDDSIILEEKEVTM